MDINNVGMNPMLDGGVNKKTMYMWIGIAVAIIVVILGFWYFGGKNTPAVTENPVNTNASTTNLVPKKAVTPTSTPDINFDAKG
ncbi:MAG: hypothetical protein WCO10_01195 [bacterium]